MIKWIPVDPNNPPEGEKIFFFEGSVYSGWVIHKEDGYGDILKDDEGFPIWETSENVLGKVYGVRFYADFNSPIKVAE